MSVRHKGKVIGWNDKKGFGFIEPSGGGGRVFVHIKSFSRRNPRPVNGDLVFYGIAKDAGGNNKAVDVGYVRDNKLLKLPKLKTLFGFTLIITYFALLAVAKRSSEMFLYVLAFYFIVSVVTFTIYAVDKSAAKNNRWRTRENTLHFFSLLGGWPGALCAQILLRHKSKKLSFKVVFWITLTLNVSLVSYLFFGGIENILVASNRV